MSGNSLHSTCGKSPALTYLFIEELESFSYKVYRAIHSCSSFKLVALFYPCLSVTSSIQTTQTPTSKWGSLCEVGFCGVPIRPGRCRLCLPNHDFLGFSFLAWCFAKWMNSNPCKQVSTQSLTPWCRPKRAYANGYAIYDVCMVAYAWGIICLVEFPIATNFLHPGKKLLKRYHIPNFYGIPQISIASYPIKTRPLVTLCPVSQ